MESVLGLVTESEASEISLQKSNQIMSRRQLLHASQSIVSHTFLHIISLYHCIIWRLTAVGWPGAYYNMRKL